MALPLSTTVTTFPPTPDRSESSTPTSTSTKLNHAALTHPPFLSHPSLSPAPLLASNLTTTLTTAPLPVPLPDSPETWSQSTHTDHMLTCSWSASSGWSTPQITPYANLSLSPMSSALHYATECFEGMKAYRGYDGKLRLFRPEMNCRRMLRSATRIALPGFDPLEMEGLIRAFVAIEGPRWLPGGGRDSEEKSRRGNFLYIRPTMIGTGTALGVQRPTGAMLFIIAACFPRLDQSPPPSLPQQPSLLLPGATPEPKSPPSNGMKLLASQYDTIRAWPGGFGNAKVGANYGPSLVAQHEARQRGYSQILWLFGEEGYVTEAGASNFFVLWRTRPNHDDNDSSSSSRGSEDQNKGKLQFVTAPLGDGLILEGVTRQSVLDLARQRWEPSGDVEVVERKFTMDELVQASEEGRLVEAFACGTAFFVASVEEIHFRGVDVELPLKKKERRVANDAQAEVVNEEKEEEEGVTGKRYATQIKRWLEEIMFGRVEHEWGVVVEEEEEEE